MTQFNHKKITALVAAVSIAITSCSLSSNSPKNVIATKQDQSTVNLSVSTLIRSDYKKNEVTELCQAQIQKTKNQLDQIANISVDQKNTDNTLLAFENVTAEFSDVTTPLTFMGYVSTDTDISAEGSTCETAVGQLYVEIFTRRDIYDSLLKISARNNNESRLLQKTLESFEQNGLKLSDEILDQVRQLKTELAAKETEFSTNLNTDDTTVLFDAKELDGIPADYLADLKKDAAGQLMVSTKESDYPVVMQNAVQPKTREKMMHGYLNRGGDANIILLSQAVTLRAQIAKLMGFNSWADYRTDGRMAKDSATVLIFLNSLKTKLAKRNQADFAKILKFKQESQPRAVKLEPWDMSYYSYQLQKRDYNLDEEKIREYFPATSVIAGLFDTYSKILGVKYIEMTDAKTWATDVKLYAIHDSATNNLIGYFYTDFFPRAGKYDHAAAFPLIAARELPNGQYSLPVSSIVANLNPPMNGKPSLLSHDDVETIFHEFGHIMHQTLSRAPYASLSGSAVAQDFVEAPSQMLENWTWNADVLNSISGHYLNPSEKLPKTLLNQMIAARGFNQAYGYTKQLLYALYDMTLHTQDGSADVNQTFLDLYKQIVGQDPLAGSKFPASFGHLMGGYDAGYYGYLWSEVYAQDMFTIFPENNLLSPSIGGSYRKNILEPGNMKDASELLKNFLGREPNSDAFFKKLGL